MPENRILLVTQELAPYLKGDLATMANEIASKSHTQGMQVRMFMPKFGAINERRNQLHEVIRLSGTNIIINDNDHPLILKVASLQPHRIQVYFLDNDDYFLKEDSDVDNAGSNRADNDERAIFFGVGSMDTLKKLRWVPTVIHTMGWISALLPLYLRKHYGDEALPSKIVYSVVPTQEPVQISPDIFKKLKEGGIRATDLRTFTKLPLDVNLLHSIAIRNADAVIFHEEPHPQLLDIVKKRKLPHLTPQQLEADPEAITKLYQTLNAKNSSR